MDINGLLRPLTENLTGRYRFGHSQDIFVAAVSLSIVAIKMVSGTKT
jgi:hypothetical protein